MARLAEIASREEELLEEVGRQALEAALVSEELEGGLALDVEALEQMHEGLRARALRSALRRVRGDLRGLGREHVVAALEVLEGAEVARDIPGVRVRRQARRLRLLPLENRRLAGVAGVECQADKS